MKNSILLLVVLLTTGSCKIANAGKNPQRKFGSKAKAIENTRRAPAPLIAQGPTREQQIDQQRDAFRVPTHDEQIALLQRVILRVTAIEQRRAGSSSQTSS